MTKKSPAMKRQRWLLLGAQLFALAAMALGLLFLRSATGGTVILFSLVSPALLFAAISIVVGVAIYTLRRRHRLFDNLEYESGDVIFHQGDPGDSVYFIQEGSVEVLRDDAVIAKLSTGQHFGEMALLADEPRNATIRAAAPTKVAALGKQNFLTMLNVLPSTEKDILSTIQARAMEDPAR